MTNGDTLQDFQDRLDELERQELIKKGFDPAAQEELVRRLTSSPEVQETIKGRIRGGRSGAEQRRLDKEQRQREQRERDKIQPPTQPPIVETTPSRTIQEQIKGTGYSRQELINLGVASDVIRKGGGESQASYEQRLISYGRGIASGYPTEAKTFTGGGAYVSKSTQEDLQIKRDKLQEQVRKAGMAEDYKKVQLLQKEIQAIDKIQKKIGGVANLGIGGGTPTKDFSPVTIGGQTVLGIGPVGLKGATGKEILDIVSPPLIRRYERLELKAREKITYPASEFIYKKTGVDIPKFTEWAKMKKTSPFSKEGFMSKVQEFEAGLVTGTLTGIKEKPVKTGITFATFALAPAAVKGIGAGAKAIGITKGVGVAIKAYPTTSRILAPVVKYGLTAAYAGSVGYRVAKTPGAFEKGKLLGEITSTEVAPMLAGYKVGAYGLSRYEQAAELRKVPPEFLQEQKALQKTYKILKGAKVKVKDVRWKRVQEIPKDAKVGKIIEEFAKKKKLVLGGTTAIETSGVNLRRLPRDVELFTGAKYRGTLAKQLGREFTKAGYKVKVSGKDIIFEGIGGHGVNIQDIRALNIGRYRYKIYKTPSGMRVADPISTAYNKVFDLLKSAKLGTPKATRIALKLEKPELIRKATAAGRIYERYPKDVVGALSTAKQVTTKQLSQLGNLNVRQVPLLQEYKMLRFGQAKELIKPYTPKLKYEEAPAVPYYYTGKQAGFLSGTKHIKSYTIKLQKNILLSKRAMTGFQLQKVKPSPYSYLPSPKVKTSYPLIYIPDKPPIQKQVYKPVYKPTYKQYPSMIPKKYPLRKPYYPSRPIPPRVPTYISQPAYYPSRPIPPRAPPPIFPVVETASQRKKKVIAAIPMLKPYPEKAKQKFVMIPQPQAYQASLSGLILQARAKKKPYLIKRKGKGVFAAGFLPTLRPIVNKRRR